MLFRKVITIIALFAVFFTLSFALVPTKKDLQYANVALDKVIPENFSGWSKLTGLTGMVAPDQQKMLDELYTQVFEGVYKNAQGEVVMLSIAFGEEQRNRMQVHFPEVCYPAQGFQIEGGAYDVINIHGNKINVKHLKTAKNSRYEDVTYWVRIGDEIVASRTEQKIVSIKYGLQGVVPDGLLFRVSSIGTENSIALHQRFISDLFGVLPLDVKEYLSSKKLTF